MNIIETATGLNRILNGLEKIDNEVYKIIKSFTFEQAQQFAADTGIVVSDNLWTLRADIRLAYDMGDIGAEAVFNMAEGVV